MEGILTAFTQQIVSLSFSRSAGMPMLRKTFSRRAAALEEKDEHAQMTRERAVYLQRLCTKGLEQLPPSQQLAPPSSLQTVGYACFAFWHLYVSSTMPATHILTAFHCCKCEGSAGPVSHCRNPRLFVLYGACIACQTFFAARLLLLTEIAVLL